MDGLPFGAGSLCHFLQVGIGGFPDADFRQRRGKFDGLAEVIDLFDDRAGPVGEEKAGQDPESDLLTVIEVMGAGQPGQSVVNGVSRPQASTFKTQAAEQGVGLHDVGQGGRDDILLAGNSG